MKTTFNSVTKIEMNVVIKSQESIMCFSFMHILVLLLFLLEKKKIIQH